MNQIAVVGGGSWGTALSLLLAEKVDLIKLWVWDASQAATMKERHENPLLPSFTLPDNIYVTTSLAEALEGVEFLLFVTPSHGAMAVANAMKQYLSKEVAIVSATKGLDGETGLTISQTLERILPCGTKIAVLSGPNLAVEVAKRIPTATVVASNDKSLAQKVQKLLMGPSLRVYTNSDVLGVELAGALKNVIAIAAGICDGMGFGDNTKAALVTRGLAEITRLGMRLGAQQSTFMGLAGVGDLMATCASPLSRNRRLGFGLGQGRKIEEVLQEIGQVAEGIPTTKAARDLAHKLGVEMPITEQVYDVLFSGKPPQVALQEVMSREPKEEVW
jgi:glycerol-3-phosphate dehydrogenase (NAD(P)+)